MSTRDPLPMVLPLPEALVFDVDGTLYRSEGSAVQAYQGAVTTLNERHGLDLPIPTPATVHGFMGYRADEIQAMLHASHYGGYVDELWDLIIAHERKVIYSGTGELFPGVLDMLSGVRDRGLPVGIYSNAPPWYFDGILDTYGVAGFAAQRDCIGAHTGWDKSRLLASVKQALGVARVWVIGDRHHDIAAAHHLGDVAIGCAYGYGGHEVEAADAVILTPMGLLGVLDDAVTQD